MIPRRGSTKAIVWTKYGTPDGLAIAEVPRPIPRRDELLIRVRATTIAAGDCELRALRFGLGPRILVRLLMGPVRPRRKVLGQEFAGDVEQVGDGVTRLRVGDPVFGTTGFRFGAYAEYLCLKDGARDSAVAIKPKNMTYAEAASVPTGGLEALHLLEQAGLLKGAHVLVIGAGGGIGLNAVQIARHFGAKVTGVENTRRLELVRSVGADRVIDYTRDDFREDSRTYDVIFDAVGSGAFASTLAAVRPGGVYLSANPSLGAFLHAKFASLTGRKRVVVSRPRPAPEDLDTLRGWVEAGDLRAVIDRQYPLDEVPAAHRYLDAGLARGRVAILT